MTGIVLIVASVIPPCRLPFTVTVDESVDIQLRAATIFAVVRWNSALERPAFRWTPIGPADITVKAIDKLPGTGIATWIAYKDTDGRFKGDRCAIRGVIKVAINTKWCARRQQRALTHELGHALGLDHSDADGPRCVMGHWTPRCDEADMWNELSETLAQRALDIIEKVEKSVDWTETSEGVSQ